MRTNPLERLSQALLTITAVPILAMVAHVTLDVGMKYLLAMPIQGTLEITAYYYMVSVVLLPLAFIELTRQSIAVDLFYLMMPFRMQVAVEGLVLLFCALAYGVFAWVSFLSALDSFATRETVMGVVAIPIWPMRFLLPFSMTLTAAVCLLLFVRLLRSDDQRRRLTAEQQIDPDTGVH